MSSLTHKMFMWIRNNNKEITMHSELAFEEKKTWTRAFGFMTAAMGPNFWDICIFSPDWIEIISRHWKGWEK